MDSKPSDEIIHIRHYTKPSWYGDILDDLCDYLTQILVDNNIIEIDNYIITYRFISMVLRYSDWFINKTDNIEAYVFMIKSLFHIRFMYFMKDDFITIYNSNDVVLYTIINTFDSICKN